MRLVLLPLLLAAGCALDSADVATADIDATLKARDAGDGTTLVEMILIKVGSGTTPQYIKLSDDDVLTATLGGDSLEMEQSSQGVVVYAATFDTAPVGETFSVALERLSGDDAPASTVSLPQMANGFGADSSFGPTSALQVSWTAVDGSARLSVRGDCIEGWSQDVDLSLAGASIPGADITSTTPDTPASCGLEVDLYAEQGGTPDPAFSVNSTANGSQLRRTTAQWSP